MQKRPSPSSVFLFIVIVGVLAIAGKFYLQNQPSSDGKIVSQSQKGTLVQQRGTSSEEENDIELSSAAYRPESMTVISQFESTESAKWQGNGVEDEKIFYEGSRSLSMVSSDRKPATVTLEQSMNLSEMEMIELMLHVTDAETYESVYVDFGDPDLKNYFHYSVTNLKNGWNLIQIPKEKFIEVKAKDAVLDWNTIAKTRVSILSRPSSIFLVRIDMMRSINDKANFLSDWRALKPEVFLSLASRPEGHVLMARNIGANTAVLKALEDINDFQVTASVSPQTSGRSGLFIRGNYNNGYGYYFLIGGDRKNGWEITKRNKDGWTSSADAVKGVIQNVVFSKEKKYWLRVDAKGDTMEFSFSFDGQTFETFGQLTDSEFRGGGVGITVFDSGSWGLFDDFQFKRF